MSAKPKAIRVTWFEFVAQLTEWLDQGEIEPMYAEAFALYCAGYSAREVGEYLHEKIYNDPLTQGEQDGEQ